MNNNCGNVIHTTGGDYCLLGGKCDLCKSKIEALRKIDVIQKHMAKSR